MWSVCGGVGCVRYVLSVRVCGVCVGVCGVCEGYQLYDRFSSKIHGPVKNKN